LCGRRFGRKPLFYTAGVIMFVMQCCTAALTGTTFTGGAIPVVSGDILIVFICLFVSAFAFSWGPLGWLVSALPLWCKPQIRCNTLRLTLLAFCE